ncbi:aminotransferase class IV [Roseovarius pelagicus]|uniref:Probable branched-chain-amino-acid aminotransferase n=1 Tax=Roseovarius pelagicus TaxID=2980108 RepID=A0ABY6DE53_9RHOB|nr:aminotransferase class IV [Roseovarius pelagicus]UXX84334.1 aminotransferase class IV [Roseovarius pelagicus]
MTDFSNGAAWIKGRIVPIAEATIGVTDWAVTHSDVTYDVVPVWDGAFFRLVDYLDRFEASIAACHMNIGMDRTEITRALTDMVAQSGLRRAYVAMVAARGTPMIPGSRDPRECANHFYGWCVPYVHVIKPDVADAGARIWLSDTVRRIPHNSVNPLAKNYHWGDFTQGLFEAKEAGFDTVLLPDDAGNVTEGPGFNVFAVKGRSVVTPQDGVLHGITRKNAMEMCAANGMDVESRALPIAELMEADEVFLSTSGGGIIPVAQIGERRFSNGAAGPVATALRAQYFERLADPAYRTEIDYPG